MHYLCEGEEETKATGRAEGRLGLVLDLLHAGRAALRKNLKNIAYKI